VKFLCMKICLIATVKQYLLLLILFLDTGTVLK